MPFIFKGLVDTLSETSQAAAAAAAATGEAVAGGAPPEAAVAVPFAMVMGYGIARSTASGAQEVTIGDDRWWWPFYCDRLLFHALVYFPPPLLLTRA